MGPMQTAAAAVALALGAPACAGPEEPAAPERFEVRLANSAPPLRGAAARVDIRHDGGTAAPIVEVTFSASDHARTWAAHVLAPQRFLQTLKLVAQVSDRPLVPGRASVQTGAPGADASMARGGSLQLSLRHGRLEGSYVPAAERGGAAPVRFAGPYVVSCSVPASALATNAAAAGAAMGAHIVDENFTSTLCKPYAALGGWR
jgi:hypothetical protein